MELKNGKILLTASALALTFLGLEGKLSWPSMAEASTNTAPIQPSAAAKSPASTTTDVAASTIDSNALNKAFTTLAARTSPAVVSIYTKTSLGKMRRGFPNLPPGMGEEEFQFFFGNPFGPRQGPPPTAQAQGSGFVINEQGYIVTNAHVVSEAGHNADEILVKFADEESNTRVKGHRAKIVGVDAADDVALLKLVDERKGLKFITFGDSDRSQVGEWVVAVGNPYGHANSITQGIVSAMGRDLDGSRTDFIQTSASINPGNSGGPLVNLAGEVIGINTAIDPRAQGIGFAIPINTVKGVISQLMETGHVNRAWLGIGIQDINEEIAGYMRLKETEGVLVKAVEPGYSADKAGLRPYDVITKINDQPILSTKDVYRSMDRLSAGSKANVEVIRDQKRLSFKIELGEQPHSS